MKRVAVAGFTGRPPEFRDDEMLIERLGARGLEASAPSWDDAATDWDSFDLVVARSPWDYTSKLEQFLTWADRIGARLENAPEVIRWNADKRYLGDLERDGVAVVETTYVGPGEKIPAIEREVVIKPSVSAGARDTGRFRPALAAEAHELIGRIGASGRTAMIQPFLAAVEEHGETAVITIAGAVSHVLRKSSLLSPDEVAPVRTDDELGVAEIMYDPGLVVADRAAEDELALAARVVDSLRARFGSAPMVARVDMLRDGSGAPVVLELEAIEPNLYFSQCAEGADHLADAIVARLGQPEAARS